MQEFDKYIIATECSHIHIPTPEEIVCHRETMCELMAVLAACTEVQQERFLLFALEGMSFSFAFQGGKQMHIINLRKHYPHYTENIFIEVSDDIYEVILLSIRQKNNHDSRIYYHNAHYSLDCNDGIENNALHRMPSPEEILMQKVSMEQLYKALNALPQSQARRVYERATSVRKSM